MSADSAFPNTAPPRIHGRLLKLGIELTQFEQMIAAIGRVLSDAQEA